MGTTTISLSEEAYTLLKAQKREGESFSDLILRKFGKGNPSTILAYLKENGPNMDLSGLSREVEPGVTEPEASEG